MWETVDPEGRRVVLSSERWRHICERHPYIDLGPEDVIGAVGQPDARVLGRTTYEEWFYREEAGPSRWIRVVVHYEGGRGFVVTAFPRRSLP
jgi:hypothetical protein